MVDVYLEASSAFIAAGVASGLAFWLVGYTIFSVFQFFNSAGK